MDSALGLRMALSALPGTAEALEKVSVQQSTLPFPYRRSSARTEEVRFGAGSGQDQHFWPGLRGSGGGRLFGQTRSPGDWRGYSQPESRGIESWRCPYL